MALFIPKDRFCGSLSTLQSTYEQVLNSHWLQRLSQRLSDPSRQAGVYQRCECFVERPPQFLIVLRCFLLLSACARKGVLLRGGQALDALARCDTVAFDKTGTLTTGELRCTSIQLLHGYAAEDPAAQGEALAVAAALEQVSTSLLSKKTRSWGLRFRQSQQS